MSLLTLRRLFAVGMVLTLAACGTVTPPPGAEKGGAPEPEEPLSKYGNPESYTVLGKSYRVLSSSKGYVEEGIASWYGPKFHGQTTSSRESYDMFAFSGAHRTLPLPTWVKVTNLDNGRSVVVRVNDRGPFHEDRIIDLSYAAADRIGIAQTGTGRVEVRALEANDPLVKKARRLRQTPSAAAPAAHADFDELSTAPTLYTDMPTREQLRAVARNSGGLFLQAGAFSSRDNAERMRAKLVAEQEMPVSVVEGRLPDQTPVFRVRVGPLKDELHGQQLSARLAELGYGGVKMVSVDAEVATANR